VETTRWCKRIYEKASWRTALAVRADSRGTGSEGKGSGTVILSVQGQAPKQSQPQEEMEKTRKAIPRSRPYGSEKWVGRTVATFGLENTLRNPGRPKKGQNNGT